MLAGGNPDQRKGEIISPHLQELEADIRRLDAKLAALPEGSHSQATDSCEQFNTTFDAVFWAEVTRIVREGMYAIPTAHSSTMPDSYSTKVKLASLDRVIVNIGNELSAAKAASSHVQWEQWLIANRFDRVRCELLMLAAEKWGTRRFGL